MQNIHRISTIVNYKRDVNIRRKAFWVRVRQLYVCLQSQNCGWGDNYTFLCLWLVGCNYKWLIMHSSHETICFVKMKLLMNLTPCKGRHMLTRCRSTFLPNVKSRRHIVIPALNWVPEPLILPFSLISELRMLFSYPAFKDCPTIKSIRDSITLGILLLDCTQHIITRI